MERRRSSFCDSAHPSDVLEVDTSSLPRICYQVMQCRFAQTPLSPDNPRVDRLLPRQLRRICMVISAVSFATRGDRFQLIQALQSDSSLHRMNTVT